MKPITLYAKLFVFTVLRVSIFIFMVFLFWNFFNSFYDIFRYILHEPTRTGPIMEKILTASYWVMSLCISLPVSYYLYKVMETYVKAMNCIALVRVYSEDNVKDKGLLALSMGEIGKNFLTVHTFFLCDMVVYKTLEDLSKYIATKELPFNMEKYRKNPLINFVLKYIKMTISISDEVVFSYLYYRTRIDRLSKVKITMKNQIKYSVDGLQFFAKHCLFLMKETLFLAIRIQIFQILITVVVMICIIYLFRFSLLQITIVMFLLLFIYQVIEHLFIVPYYLTHTIITFFNMLDAPESELDKEHSLSVEELIKISPSFKELLDQTELRVTDKEKAEGHDADAVGKNIESLDKKLKDDK